MWKKSLILWFAVSALAWATDDRCGVAVSAKVRSLIENQIGGQVGRNLLVKLESGPTDLQIFRSERQYVFFSSSTSGLHRLLVDALGTPRLGTAESELNRLLLAHRRDLDRVRAEFEAREGLRVGRIGWALFAMVGAGLVVVSDKVGLSSSLQPVAEWSGWLLTAFGIGRAGWEHLSVRRAEARLADSEARLEESLVANSTDAVRGMLGEVTASDVSLFYFDPPSVLREKVAELLPEYGFEKIPLTE